VLRYSYMLLLEVAYYCNFVC